MRSALLFLAAAAVATPALAQGPDASAPLIDTKGKSVGTVWFTEAPQGVLIDVQVRSLPAGPHGMHIHSVGTCNDRAAGFKASQGHVKGGATEHGLLNPKGAEVGDLPNVYVGRDGTARAQFFSTQLSLRGAGGRPRLLDENGSAILIHASADDHVTQPIGGAGDRIACGVIAGG